MNSLLKIRSVLLTIGLVLFISMTGTSSFGSGESWAHPSFMRGGNSQQTQVAAMDRAKVMAKDVEGKAQEMIGNMTGDAKNQVGGKAKQLEAKTREGINTSIDNASYKPSGRSQQAEKQAEKASKGAETQARDAFK